MYPYEKFKKNIYIFNNLFFILFKGKSVIFYKYGTIYRDVMHTPMMNWCELMNVKTQNMLVKSLTEVVQENFPEIVHECPYQVRNTLKIFCGNFK